MKPNKERIKLWVEALRSGKFKQGKDYLRDAEERCCCLGVACEVAMANGLKAKLRYSEQDGKQCVVYEFKNSTPMYGCLPEAVVKWFGLPDRNPELLTRAKRGSDFCASDLNDGMGYGFKRIATAIERTYLRDEA